MTADLPLELTVGMVARLVGVSWQAVDGRIRRGLLPARTILGVRLVPRHAAVAWRREREGAARPNLARSTPDPVG